MRVDRNASFARFVYPFRFDPDSFDARAQRVRDSAWSLGETPAPLWRPDRFVTDQLLPHMGRFLNPDGETGEAPAATALLWKLHDEPLRSPDGLGAGGAWTLVCEGGEVPFEFADVRLALFRVGVGFLTFDTCPRTEEPDDWWCFLHYFRIFDVGDPNRPTPRLRAVWPDDARCADGSPPPGFPVRADGRDLPEADWQLVRLVDLLLKSAAAETEDTWWTPLFVPWMLLPYAGLFLDEVPPGTEPRLLYRFRNFFHASQFLHPSADDLRPDQPALLPYVERAWLVCTRMGGGFLGCDVPRDRFFRHILPRHLRRAYYLLFLLALQQRFTLTALSTEVAEHWLPGDDPDAEHRRDEAFERLREGLLSFTARSHFTQVAQSDHHHRAYRRWQEVFDIDGLYHEVRGEVRELHADLQARRQARILEEQERQAQDTARLERRVTVLGLLLGVPSLLLGLLSINVRTLTADEGLTPRWFAVVATTLTVWLAASAAWAWSGVRRSRARQRA